MSSTLKLTILSPERRLLQGAEVLSATLPGSEGQIQILPGHAAIMGTLETGVFSYETAQQGENAGVISSGFFEVKDDQVTLMAETIELKGEVDFDRAKQAQKKAESVLSEAGLDEHRFKKYQLKLQRSLIRQQFAGKDHG